MPPPDSNSKLARLQRWRMVATGALVFAGLLFLLGSALEHQNPFWGWVRAFGEAAMVGALADWFAVVALFKHPMGIPFPHSGVVRRNQPRIAATIGDFFVNHFWQRETLEPFFAVRTFAPRLADWLEEQKVSLAEGVPSQLRAWMSTIPEANWSATIRQIADRLALQIDPVPLASRIIDTGLEAGWHDSLFKAAAPAVATAVRENRAFLEAKIREEIPLPEELPLKFGGFKLPSEFVDEWMKGVKGAIAAFVAERVIDKIEGTIAEVATMPDHPIRAGFDQRLRVLATTLQEDPASAEKLRQWRDELLASEGWSRAVESAATTIRQGIENPAGTSGDWLHTSIQKGAAAAITHAIAQLRDADGWGGKLDVMVRDKLIEISLSQTTQVRILLENTVAKWPSNKMSDQLELELGADLQFVRLNGTLVGGLVGLVLHAIGIMFG